MLLNPGLEPFRSLIRTMVDPPGAVRRSIMFGPFQRPFYQIASAFDRSFKTGRRQWEFEHQDRRDGDDFKEAP